MKKKRLGEVLRERGHVSHADLNRAIEEQHGKLIHLGELLLDRGVVSRNDLAAALTEITRVPYIDCAGVEPDPEVLKLLPRAVAKRCCVLPLHCQNAKLVAVMAEPQNLQIIDELRFMSGMDIVPRLAFRGEIESAIDKWYAAAEQGEAVLAEAIAPAAEDPGMEFISTSSLQRNIDAMQEMQAELLHKSTPAVRLVASTINAAALKQASDIHIEPQSTDTIIRLRVDGMLRDYQHVPRAV